MRHVIYLLLVANLVFFGWHILQIQKQGGVERALPALPVTAKPLFLMSAGTTPKQYSFIRIMAGILLTKNMGIIFE